MVFISPLNRLIDEFYSEIFVCNYPASGIVKSIIPRDDTQRRPGLPGLNAKLEDIDNMLGEGD